MKHDPLMLGNPTGTCPEYGTIYFDEDGNERERCPVCGLDGPVLYADKLVTVNDLVKEAHKIFKENLAILTNK